MRMFFGILHDHGVRSADPVNDGYYDLIDVRIPEGSLLKPRFPAALSGRTHALGRIFDVLGGLLGQRRRSFLNAAGFSSSPHLFYSGHRRTTAATSSCSRSASAASRADRLATAPTGIRCGPNFTNVPNEFLERYFR